MIVGILVGISNRIENVCVMIWDKICFREYVFLYVFLVWINNMDFVVLIVVRKWLIWCL